MLLFALKMLSGDRAKFIGILIGLTFASFIITQQMGIFIGLMMRTYGFVTDTSQPDIWVMDPKVQYIEDVKPLRMTELYRVKGIEGIEWAVPLYKGQLKARLASGNYQICNIIGIDDSSLIGGPPIMKEGSIMSLRRPDAIIVNDIGAKDRLAYTPGDPGQPKIPLHVGEVLEINDRRAEVTGICQVLRTFRSEPVIYTTFSRALRFAPVERNLLSFILVKGKKGVNTQELCDRIKAVTGLSAYTANGFKKLTVQYYIKNTGILINFGFAVILGFIIGTVISGQMFYNFALDNLRYFAAYKAMGASRTLLIKMVLVQALMVAALGWAFGIGFASFFGIASLGSELSFKLPWELLIGSGIALLIITLLAAFVSIYKIMRLEPAIVFQS